MNVLSLPDEMLASVLKYNSFEDVTAIRKVSSKIDSVARRYGLDKMKAESLRIGTDKKKVLVSIDGLQYRKPLSSSLLGIIKHYFSKKSKIPEHRKDFTRPPSADILDTLKYYFSKIRGVKHLHLQMKNFTGKRMSISSEVGEFLLGNDCKNLTTLQMSFCEISINFDTMRNIMTKLKPKNLDIYATFTEFEFSDALIEGIPFDSLALCEAIVEKSLGISLPYLTRLCSFKIPSTLSCTIYNSTVSDLIMFFEGWTKEMLNTVNFWRISGISKETMSDDETKQSLTKLKCFEECKVMYLNDVSANTWFFISSNRENENVNMRILVVP